VTTINPIYTSHEIARQLTMSKAQMILTFPNVLDIVKDASSKLTGLNKYLILAFVQKCL
jgi:hypothetical protein